MWSSDPDLLTGLDFLFDQDPGIAPLQESDSTLALSLIVTKPGENLCNRLATNLAFAAEAPESTGNCLAHFQAR